MGNLCWSQTFFRSLYAPDESMLFKGIVKQNNDSFITFLGKNGRGLTIAKIDTVGEVLTTKELRMSNYGFYDDDFKAVITPDSSIVIVNSVYQIPFATKIFVAKLNKKTEPVWVKLIETTTAHDVGSGIKLTSDGGFIISGKKEVSAAYLMKLDSSGNVQWSKIFNRNRLDAFSDVEQVGNAYYSVGFSDSIGVNGSFGLIVKTDFSGNTIWTKGLGNPLNRVKSILKDGDSLIISGTTRNKKPYLCKLDTNGNIKWIKVYHFDQETYQVNMIRSRDGGFVISGAYGTERTSDKFGWYTVKTNTNGEILWSKIYGGNADYYVPEEMQELADRSILSIAMYAKSTAIFLVYKSDSLGNCPGICELSYSPTVSSITVLDSAIVFDESFDVAYDTDIEYSMTYDTLSSIDSCDIDWVRVQNVSKEVINIYPNPSNGLIHFDLPFENTELCITNLIGQTVYRNKFKDKSIQVNLGDFMDGIYICTLTSQKHVWRQKIVLSKQ